MKVVRTFTAGDQYRPKRLDADADNPLLNTHSYTKGVRHRIAFYTPKGERVEVRLSYDDIETIVNAHRKYVPEANIDG